MFLLSCVTRRVEPRQQKPPLPLRPTARRTHIRPPSIHPSIFQHVQITRRNRQALYIPYTTRHHHHIARRKRRRKQDKKMYIGYISQNPYTYSFFFFSSIHFGSHLYPNPFVMLYQTISASGCWGSCDIISQVHKQRVVCLILLSILYILLSSPWIIRHRSSSFMYRRRASGRLRQNSSHGWEMAAASNHFPIQF